MLGVAKLELVVSLTLAVLALLAFSILASRHQIEEATRRFSGTAGIIFADDFPVTIKDDLERATEVWLVGVTLSRTTKTYYSTIESKLRAGHTVRVLILHPEGPVVQMAEMRVYGRTDVERTSNEIRGVLQDWCELKALAPEKLQLRTIQNPLGYGAIAASPNTNSGVLYLEHYPFKTTGGSKPRFVLKAKDGPWFEFFKQELQTLWDHGNEWPCR